eukprot:TRINITY_DN68615_c0_g1_i1.p1 TRINITY_DN68615_c0_g1~~TRINITY_DN68615_c0_g1_i1.p1  ORF type:complete len:225 (+),score=67.70 TRINITY_DN68615_c0_g1_i1:73-747(+)
MAKSKANLGKALEQKLSKTKMCIHFEKNQCKYGEDCTFAHSEEELQPGLDLKKTRLCKAFERGKCNKDNCPFAHGEDELRAAGASAENEEFVPDSEAANSVGSAGHPHSCGLPCKYFWKPRGCKDGTACDRCHICRWTAAAGNAGKKKRAREDGDAGSVAEPEAKRRKPAAAPPKPNELSAEELADIEDILDEKGNSCPIWLQDERRRAYHERKGRGKGGYPHH